MSLLVTHTRGISHHSRGSEGIQYCLQKSYSTVKVIKEYKHDLEGTIITPGFNAVK